MHCMMSLSCFAARHAEAPALLALLNFWPSFQEHHAIINMFCCLKEEPPSIHQNADDVPDDVSETEIWSSTLFSL